MLRHAHRDKTVLRDRHPPLKPQPTQRPLLQHLHSVEEPEEAQPCFVGRVGNPKENRPGLARPMNLPVNSSPVQLPLQPVKRLVVVQLDRPRLDTHYKERVEQTPKRPLLDPRLEQAVAELDQIHNRLLLAAEREHVAFVQNVAHPKSQAQPTVGHRVQEEPPPHLVEKQPQIQVGVELRQPSPLHRDKELKRGPAAHRKAGLLRLLQPEHRQERLVPTPLGLCSGPDVQPLVGLLPAPVVHVEQHLLVRGQRPRLFEVHHHLRQRETPLVNHPPLPLACLDELARPHKRLEQPPVTTRALVKQRGDGPPLPQPRFLIAPPKPVQVASAWLLPKRAGRAVVLLRPWRAGLR